MTTALLVIDMQRGYFRDAQDHARLAAHLPAVDRLIRAFAAAGEPVVFARTVHDPDGSTWTLKMRAEGKGIMLAGSEDVRDVEGLVVPDGALSVAKTRNSAFLRTDLEALLRGHGVDDLVLCGIFFEACVGETASDAVEHDFPTRIASDATLRRRDDRAEAMRCFLEEDFEVASETVDAIVAGLKRAA